MLDTYSKPITVEDLILSSFEKTEVHSSGIVEYRFEINDPKKGYLGKIVFSFIEGYPERIIALSIQPKIVTDIEW